MKFEEALPLELLAVAQVGDKIVDLTQKADALVTAAKGLAPLLESVTRRDLQRWQFEGQLVCAMILLGAEEMKVKAPSGMEMAAIVLLIDMKLSTVHVRTRNLNKTIARANAWEKQITKARRYVPPALRRFLGRANLVLLPRRILHQLHPNRRTRGEERSEPIAQIRSPT